MSGTTRVVPGANLDLRLLGLLRELTGGAPTAVRID